MVDDKTNVLEAVIKALHKVHSATIEKLPFFDALVGVLWELDMRFVRPLTHVPGPLLYTQYAVPRAWALRLRIGKVRLVDHPWAWCGCGARLDTFQELRAGACRECQFIRDLEEENRSQHGP